MTSEVMMVGREKGKKRRLLFENNAKNAKFVNKRRGRK